MNEGYIYLVSTDDYSKKNIYKIGCTKNIDRRISELNFARIPDDFFKVFFKIKTLDYFYFESIIHNFYTHKKVYNEFYELDDINKVIDEIKNIIITRKSKIILHLEILYNYMHENKIKWNGNFFVENNNIMYNSEVFINKIKDIIFKSEKYKLSKYMSNTHWNTILSFAKQKNLNNEEDYINLFEKLYV